MKTWYVKKLSKQTNLSVRTLHYYDKIGLLKPSGRAPNGYRVYSENDLRKLEQIIALKFFGFTLAQIEMLLRSKLNTLKLLKAQLNLLQEEVSFLEHAQRKLLIKTINDLEVNNHVNWHHIVELIDAYAKTKERKRTQAAQALLNERQNNEETEEQRALYHKILYELRSDKKNTRNEESSR